MNIFQTFQENHLKTIKTNKRLSRVPSDNLLKNIFHMPEIPVIKYCENNIEFYLAIKYIRNLGREYNKVSL